jgi:hypothetical protein
VAYHVGTQKPQECELTKRRKMADTETTEASGSTTEAEPQPTQSITTLEELTASFVDKVEESEAKEESEVIAESETQPTDTEADQDQDVLLQSTETEESDEEETEEVANEEESDESEAEEPPKAVGKLLKQVGKLTARAKTAEEVVDTLKAEIQALKANPQKQSETSQPALEDVQDFQALETLRKEALAAKKFALQHIGKDFVEVDGREYSDDDIRNILTQADEYLTEKIPERAQHLQSAAQWQQDTINTHPWISETVDSDIAEERRGVFNQLKSQYANVLNALPNGDFIAATLVRGVEAIKADQAAKTAKPKAKKVAKAPPPTMGDSSPPVQTSVTRKTAQKQKILERKRLSENDLAALLAE